MQRLACPLTLLLLLLLAVAAPAGAATPRDYIRMSDERTRTWSAYVNRSTWVRSAPTRKARRRALLRELTYHGAPEVVVVLGSAEVAGTEWFHVRYSGLGTRRGWVPAAGLELGRMIETRLVLDLGARRLKLMRGRRVLFSTPVGIGAAGSPTPRGQYFIRERLGPFRSTNSIYGALAFGTSAYSPHRTDWPGGGQVGVHGTNQPGLIPGRISNGCVRLRNSAVLRLGRMLRVGTPWTVR